MNNRMSKKDSMNAYAVTQDRLILTYHNIIICTHQHGTIHQGIPNLSPNFTISPAA